MASSWCECAQSRQQGEGGAWFWCQTKNYHLLSIAHRKKWNANEPWAVWVGGTKHNRGDWGNVVQNRMGPVSHGNCVTGTMMNQEYSLYLRRQELVHAAISRIVGL